MTDKTAYFAGLMQEVFDPKKTGFIDISEVEGVLGEAGYGDEKETILELLSYLTPDKEGRISIHQAQFLFDPAFVSLSDPSNLQNVFEHFDADKDDFISVTDLVTTSQELGFIIEPEQSQVMVATFDVDGDKQLSYEEFNRIFCD
mmetsp:Transcript_7087/g.12963  ORF Transcript_7087/g.12963 Transcript_7087/m.12963 type:complete len:145 (-) Transcript_7087:659-1093(-)